MTSTDLETGAITGDIQEQTYKVFGNLELALKEAGSSLTHMIKVTAFLADISEFDAYNQLYREYFAEGRGRARMTVQVREISGLRSRQLHWRRKRRSPYLIKEMRMSEIPIYRITKDEHTQSPGQGPEFVTFGETMVRETPADMERPERTRLVRLSMAGSEFTLATGLSRLGISSAYITRVPDNPYGWALRNTARAQGVNTDYFVWAPKTEPIGRFIYEIGRTPRKNTGVYQRMYSAASRLGAGMTDWQNALRDACLFHTSGITFGLATHSQYDRNYNYEAFKEALEAKPKDCLVGLDFNYRGTLWTAAQAREVMTPIVSQHVDILITTIEDMAKLYDIPCGQYSAKQVVDGELGEIRDNDVQTFAKNVMDRFENVNIVAITIRYPDTFEEHRWESASMDREGYFFRSPSVKKIALMDRLGGGDTWNAGFYYGLLTENLTKEGIRKGVLVGDAATRLKQTLMFDLPIVQKNEIEALMVEDVKGGGRRTTR
jgi:2-dehydro-3-deoxygluconokinase